MKFGWMTLSQSPSAADDLACVHRQLEQGVLAEAMGFDAPPRRRSPCHG